MNAVTTEMCSKRPLHGYVLGVVLSTSLGAPTWGADDTVSQHPPLFKNSSSQLDIGFKASPRAKSYSLSSCAGSCLSRTAPVSRIAPDQTLPYEQDSNLNLGQTGPFSIQFSGRRLKMEVNF